MCPRPDLLRGSRDADLDASLGRPLNTRAVDGSRESDVGEVGYSMYVQNRDTGRTRAKGHDNVRGVVATPRPRLQPLFDCTLS